MLRAATVEPNEPDRWIELGELRDKFDKIHFEISHRLAEHPLLQLPELMKLAERTLTERPSDLYHDMGEIGVGQLWKDVPPARFSPQDALKRIEDCGAWFIFRSAQHDPQYHQLFDRGLSELKAWLGPAIARQILREDIIIFVTSPNRVTSYHIDRECNFLLQIRGSKTLHVFDREDREVLPETEIERFWAVNNNAAIYKPHLQDRACSYRMAPGTGVHIPVNCPHWIQNDDNVSVSLSVNFQFVDSLRASMYRANFYLRRLGLNPSPPGRNTALDAMKHIAISNPAVTGALAKLRSLRGKRD